MEFPIGMGYKAHFHHSISRRCKCNHLLIPEVLQLFASSILEILFWEAYEEVAYYRNKAEQWNSPLNIYK